MTQVMLSLRFEVLADFGRVIWIDILNIGTNRFAVLLKMLSQILLLFVWIWNFVEMRSQ